MLDFGHCVSEGRNRVFTDYLVMCSKVSLLGRPWSVDDVVGEFVVIEQIFLICIPFFRLFVYKGGILVGRFDFG